MKKIFILFAFLINISCEKDDRLINFEEYSIPEKLMQNYCALGASTAAMNWQKEVALQVSENYKNYAIASTRWAHTVTTQIDYSENATDNDSNKVMANQLARLLKDKKEKQYYPDLITVMCGINDAGNGITNIGNYDEIMALNTNNVGIEDWFNKDDYKKNRESIYGSTSFVIEQLIRNFPDAQIIIIIPQQVNLGPTYHQNLVVVNSAVQRIASRYSLAIIDVFKESGITNVNGLGSQYLSADGLHPNSEGEKLLTLFVTNKIKYLYFKKG